jgi:hypothetical protein
MKISAIINNLGPSQMAFYLIKEFNKLSKEPENSCCVFTELSGVFVTRPLFSCYSVAFFPEYNGVSISTTLQEARSLLQTSNNASKYLYLWDLDWTQGPVNHEAYCNIMLDDRIKIIARSERHAKCIENFCNKSPIGVLDNWNHKELLKILGEQNEQN